MYPTIIVLNAITSLASASLALLALVRPAKMSESPIVTFGERYYARLYAARSLPFELASAVLPLTTHGEPVFFLLLFATAIQAGDVAIAVAARKRGMAFGATAAALIHVACALAAR